ncbi:DUF6115 domain-containing protein [Halalkalibacter alkaliphilus]|uniref:Uncharacterized protein n=1 Tax=Halalkalibacter alkaliphilus TaxID=2917993 RepID=A0A9X2A3Z7_9BACI|nr:capsid protein p24 [Halalkalibacter alkaliphilus]MCL7746492.1 hypothetical protein [Halalkalibacter alkaliphilus]
MTTLLVTISLLLHAFTFLWILTLMRQQPHSSKENYEQIKNEIEDLLVSYTAEMKEENEQLVKQLKEHKEKATLETNLKPSSHVTPKKHENHKQLIDDKTAKYKDYIPPIVKEDTEADVYQQSETAKVISLSNQGLDTSQIAKKLGLGKGEVELMLKFYR